MKDIALTLALLITYGSGIGQTVQGTIQKTGTNVVTVYGKPSANLNAVLFDNIVVCISIPSQSPNPTPNATISSNFIPNFAWTVPSGYPHTTNGRTYYAFNGNDNNNGQTSNWTSGNDNNVLQVTFTNGAPGSTEIVRLDDRTLSGGGPGYDYWYVQIVALGDVTAYGNLFYGTGAVNSGDSFVPTSQSVSLPIELIALQVQGQNSRNHLTWRTTSENNNAHFEIQYSPNCEFFETIGKIVGHGTTLEAHNYQFNHENPGLGKHYYRLRQVDFDGKFSYSNVVSVDVLGVPDLEKFSIWPNPGSGIIHIDKEIPEDAEIIINDLFGRQMPVRVIGGQFDVSQIPNGVYYITINTELESWTQQFVKQ